MRDFPARAVVDAIDVSALAAAVDAAFAHLRGLRRHPYPLERAVALVRV
jgi:hypothetical protein